MYISDLMLRDFGSEVFQDARMAGIDEGLVVVGGPQRSGKTTLLHAIRRLGYGIEKDAAIPPPADEFNVRANVQNDGHEYVLKVTGYRDPTLVSTAEGPDISVGELFGSISKRQYQQLFTITLDELKRIPNTVDDAEAVSEVLLGAAYGDVAVIPEMESTFDDRAYDIGRKYGKPTKNSELRNPMEIIEDGIDQRDEANKQVEEWSKTREDLENVEGRITEIETKIEEQKHKKERLTVLTDEFESLREYQDLRDGLETDEIVKAEAMPDDAVSRAETLKEEFNEKVNRREELRDALAQGAPSDDIDEYKQDLLAHAESLDEYEHQIAKWKSQAEQVIEEENELRRERNQLEARVSEIHDEWSGEFEPVLDIQTDSLSKGEVRSIVEEYKQAKSDLEEAEAELGEANRRLEKHEEQLDKEPESDQDGHVRWLLVKTGIIGIASVAVGVGGTIAGSPIWGGIAGSALLILGLYAVISGADVASETVETTRELQTAINSAEADIKAIESRRKDASKRMQSAEQRLSSIKQELGLPGTVQPDSVQEFYERVEECKSDILALQQAEADLAEERDLLTSELAEAAATLSTVRSYPWNEEMALSEADELFRQLEIAASDLDLAQTLDQIEAEIHDVESDIEDLFAEWESIDDLEVANLSQGELEEELSRFQSEADTYKSVLEDIDRRDTIEEQLENKLRTGSTKVAFDDVKEGDESRLEVLERVAEGFDSSGEVQASKEDVTETLDRNESELSDKSKKKVKLEEKLKSLKSDDDIVEARKQISEGREELRKLGEEYAVNRVSQYLTERLHERFIEEVAGPLIDDASEIFHRITQEYEGIDHNEQFDDLDFEALRDGKPPHGSNELSRATAEQLFLAVRLARIRQLDVSLPIVFDDAITNFDPAHGARTLRTVADLAETNQVFLLTCHPEAVMLAESYGSAAQYWCLENGRFDGPYSQSDPVYELLHSDGQEEEIEQTS